MKPRVTDLSELLFVSSGPVLRCSGSALTNRWAGVLYNESYVHGSCVPSPAGVPAHESSISWEGPDHESPGGCWVPAQGSSISWEGPDHESPTCWEGVMCMSVLSVQPAQSCLATSLWAVLG